jgi:hypothetical protein
LPLIGFNPNNIFAFSLVFMEDHRKIVDLKRTYDSSSSSQGLPLQRGQSNMVMQANYPLGK